MRTPILVAAVLVLSATAVQAAPRSLSGPQPNPVQTAPEAEASETPVFKVQSVKEAKPSIQPQAPPPPQFPASTQAAPAAAQAAPAAPQTAPAAAPADAPASRAAETKPTDTNVAPAKPVRHAQRKHRRQPMTVEQRIDRELRSIERSIGAMGAAGAISAISSAIPLVVYW